MTCEAPTACFVVKRRQFEISNAKSSTRLINKRRQLKLLGPLTSSSLPMINLRRARFASRERDGYLPPARLLLLLLPPSHGRKASASPKRRDRTGKKKKSPRPEPMTWPEMIIAVAIETSRQNLRRDRKDTNAATGTNRCQRRKKKTFRRKVGEKKRDPLSYYPPPPRLVAS